MNCLEAYQPLEIKRWTGEVPGDEVIQQLCRISEESFPPEEREPCQALIKTIRDGRSILYTASTKNSIRGFTKLTPLKKTKIYLMEYLAVETRSRNRGIGKEILQFIKKDLKAVKGLGLILEVEPPEVDGGEEREIRLRRIRFYQRNGALIVHDGGAYRMPNLAGEGSLPMHLMWLPISAEGKPPIGWSISDLFTLIFTEMYAGENNKILLHSIIEGLPDPHAPIELGVIQ
jgi:hypothetical protein